MTSTPLMRLERVAKTYPNGTVALKGVDLDIGDAQVHGLLGANGAGKSTLIKILSGGCSSSGGAIQWKGADVRLNSPKDAREIGIATIHQHIPLVPNLSVLENVVMAERGVWRISAAHRQRYEVLCERLGYWLDPDRLVQDISIGRRQMVAILQALSSGAELIVMDEPTASLAREERELVYRVVDLLSRGQGKSILFVSHFLDEVMALTDCVTVLRDGEAVMRANTIDLDESKIAEAIVGREIVALEHGKQKRPALDLVKNHVPRLEIRQLASAGKLSPTNLKVAAGEVIGVAGLLGSGRSELLHAVFGSDSSATGEVFVDGQRIKRSPVASVRAGISLVPEDRLAQGLVPNFEIWRNITLCDLGQVSRFGLFPLRERERDITWRAIQDLSIKTDGPDILVSELSGGNAQKVTIAKWLYGDNKVFLLDEPTAGIDIGAKTDILKLVRALSAAGQSVLIVSSEMEELLAVSDRILVMRDGACVAEVAGHETSEHELVLLAGGRAASKKNNNARAKTAESAL